MDTFQWQVNYLSGQLVTGQDLLNAVFGTPVVTGTYNSFGFDYPYLTSSNGSFLGAGYIGYSFGNFLESVTIAGKNVPTVSPLGWTYYNAGGFDQAGVAGVIYPDGNWISSNSGVGTRQLANGSYDGWVYGFDGYSSMDPTAIIEGTGYLPLVSNFSGATLIDLTSVPEPGRVALLFIGASCMVMRRRRVSIIQGGF